MTTSDIPEKSEPEAGAEAKAQPDAPPSLGVLSFDTGNEAYGLLRDILEQPVAHGSNGLGQSGGKRRES